MKKAELTKIIKETLKEYVEPTYGCHVVGYGDYELCLYYPFDAGVSTIQDLYKWERKKNDRRLVKVKSGEFANELAKDPKKIEQYTDLKESILKELEYRTTPALLPTIPGKYRVKFMNRFKDKNIDVDDVMDILETNPEHGAISVIRKKYPNATDQDISDLIGTFATTPYRNKIKESMKKIELIKLIKEAYREILSEDLISVTNINDFLSSPDNADKKIYFATYDAEDDTWAVGSKTTKSNKIEEYGIFTKAEAKQKARVLSEKDSNGIFADINATINAPGSKPGKIKFNESRIIKEEEQKFERNANKYFGLNHFQDNYMKGFEYKDVTEYSSLKEWLDNVFIAMNENASLRKAGGNHASIMDKRLGHTYSKMGFYLTTEQEKKLWDEEECKKFLTNYYNKNHKLKEEIIKESATYNKVAKDIENIKAKLINKWKTKGGYENFGQTEVRQLKDKYDYTTLVYGTPDQRSIAQLLDSFDDWCMNYDGR